MGQNSESQNKVVDWKHLETDHHRYLDRNLNRVRLDDFKRLINKYFEIVQWKETIIARERLNDEKIRKSTRNIHSTSCLQMLYMLLDEERGATGLRH